MKHLINPFSNVQMVPWDGALDNDKSLRDWFAGQALAAMEVKDDGEFSPNDHERKRPQLYAKWKASAAYRIAEAMLAERAKQTEGSK